MDNFEFFKNFNKLSEAINKALNPLDMSQWLYNTNPKNTLSFLVNSHSVQNQLNSIYFKPKTIDWSNYFSILNLHKKFEIDYYNEVSNKIRTIGYWGDLVKASLIYEATQNFNDETFHKGFEDIENNIDIINSNIEQIENNPIEFFNSIFLIVKDYIDKNPSIKYSTKFIFFLIMSIVTPIIINKLSNNTDPAVFIQVTNNITNNYNNTPSFIINSDSIFIKSLPRQDAKDVFQVYKDDELKILKENRIWVLVIKINTADSGWIKKENLHLLKAN